MKCSYCGKAPRGGIVLELLEDVKGAGPTKKHACFPCISEIGEKIMRPPAPPKIEVKGRCEGCGQTIPPGFYVCSGDGAHQFITR